MRDPITTNLVPVLLLYYSVLSCSPMSFLVNYFVLLRPLLPCCFWAHLAILFPVPLFWGADLWVPLPRYSRNRAEPAHKPLTLWMRCYEMRLRSSAVVMVIGGLLEGMIL